MSFQHEPDQKKQKLSLPFSSTPLPLTFEATAKFANSSQKVLKTIDFNAPFLYLPRISPNNLSYRFKLDDNALFVVNRKSLDLVKSSIKELPQENYGLNIW